nr:MAG TPA: hypothetical protein [Caudoviricetes sp.]
MSLLSHLFYFKCLSNFLIGRGKRNRQALDHTSGLILN